MASEKVKRDVLNSKKLLVRFSGRESALGLINMQHLMK